MRLARVQFASWDKIYDFSFMGLDLAVGDKVIVKTDLGTELGELVAFKNITGKEEREMAARPDNANAKEKEATTNTNGEDSREPGADQEREIKPILRKATPHDLERTVGAEEKRAALVFCREMKIKHNLPMKFIDAHFSFDGSRITFAFIADGRVDFRELVKDLTRHFGRTIRLQQIGIRDEAKVMGDYGHCGRPLCCRRFLKELTSITSEMAELQQCSHRGSERISGICGRLMCCLAYEECGYEEVAARLVPIGTKVSVDGKKGIVVGHHILKQSVDVEFGSENSDGRTIVEVDLNRNKKKKLEK